MADNREKNETSPLRVPEDARDDLAEKPGTDAASTEESEKLVDEWEVESFPASDPPAHY